jgi:hypothetical protein
MKKLKLKELISELVTNRNEDILDKTKCSVTAKNIYNYIINNYTDTKKTIDWNDTLQEDYVTIDKFKPNKNEAYYVYYDHVTGETSHYFIILFDNKYNFHILQSAVFEYSMMDWINPEGITKIFTKWDDSQFGILKKEQEKIDNKEKENTILRLTNTKNVSNNYFIEGLENLQGYWVNDCENKCKLFTELFACKMDSLSLSKKFKLDEKYAEFRLRCVKLNISLTI